MSLDDKVDVELVQFKKDSDVGITEIIWKAAVCSGIAAIPVVGASINEVFSGLAQRRAQERIKVVFDAMKERLDDTLRFERKTCQSFPRQGSRRFFC